MKAEELKTAVRNLEPKARSAWRRGVVDYAEELLFDADPTSIENAKTRLELKKVLLNGADDWHQYSWGGCSLIYDSDIAERLCNPSELKRKRGGDLPPSRNEEWLDVQARALRQASWMIGMEWLKLQKKGERYE